MDLTRVVCLNCMDGRVQLPVIHWIKDNYGVEHVDLITEAGMDGFLADRSNEIDAVNKKIQISIDKNRVAKIFIVGHYDCKGNLVSEDDHKVQVIAAVERIRQEFGCIEVIGLWVNDRWEVEEIE